MPFFHERITNSSWAEKWFGELNKINKTDDFSEIKYQSKYSKLVFRSVKYPIHNAFMTWLHISPNGVNCNAYYAFSLSFCAISC